ncbi:MAG: YggT family protein [Firmicutes bacterium]|nr:YggT family protein [Bacillota bacterium]
MYLFLMRAVNLLFRVLSAMILVYCVLSWFVRPGSALYRVYCFLDELVEPLIYPFRKLTSGVAYSTGVDFAPWLTLIFFNVLQNAIYLVLRSIFL